MATTTGKAPAPTQQAGGYTGNWRKLSEVHAWASEQQSRMRRYAGWIDMTTKSIETTFKRSAAKRLGDKVRAAWRARKATHQWYRAAAHIDAAADCMSRGWKITLDQFPELIEPQKNRQDPFDWQG
jgi:hypothetical protein